MLIRQASINLIGNVASALLGLMSVSIFTRLFSPHEYGVFLLGTGFAVVVGVFLVGWFRNLILTGHAREDGTDVRGNVLAGYAIGCLAIPVAYELGRLLGLDRLAALLAVALAVSIGLFELTQDLLRARLETLAVIRALLVRAIAALCFGVVVALLQPSALLLLSSSAFAYLLAAGVQARKAWKGTVLTFSVTDLLATATRGLPLTLSLTSLAVAGVTDRFMIAALVGPTDAGKYVASLELVRQTLMLPAISAAAAFFPLAVKLHTRGGDAAVRAHLSDCAELLFGMMLPASLGLAVIAPHLANVVLGADFRELAAQIMPIVALAVLFQILTQQYLHASFLLSGRNVFYLVNTAAIMVANVLLSYLLVGGFGTVGAAWARLGADVIGFACALALSRLAFPIPLPFRRLAPTMIAGLAMALTVGVLDRSLHVNDVAASVVLIGTGVFSCAIMYWLLDVAGIRGRLKHRLSLFRSSPTTAPGRRP